MRGTFRMNLHPKIQHLDDDRLLTHAIPSQGFFYQDQYPGPYTATTAFSSAWMSPLVAM